MTDFWFDPTPVAAQSAGGVTHEATATLALTLVNTSTPVNVKSATASLALIFSNTSTPVAIHETTASLPLTLVNTSTPVNAKDATASLALTFVNTSTPANVKSATASLPLTMVNSVTSTAVHEATATLATSMTNTATPVNVKSATASLPVTLVNSASQENVKSATASLALVFSNTAAPAAGITQTATASLPLTMANSVTETAVHPATASLPLSMTNTSTADRVRSATASLAVTFSNSSTSDAIHPATASLPLSMTNTATSNTAATQTATAALALSMTNSATPVNVKSATASLAVTFSNTVTEARVRSATASLALTMGNSVTQANVKTATASLSIAFSNTSTPVNAKDATASLPLTMANASTPAGVKSATGSLALTFSNSATAPASVWGTVSERFSGGSVGATVTTGNTIFSSIGANSSNVKFASGTVDGTAAQKIFTTTPTDMEFLGAFPTVSTDYYWRGYYTFSSLLAATNQLLQIEDASGNITAGLQIGSTGVIRLRDGATTVATSAATPVGAPFRLEIDALSDAGTLTCRIYSGANLHGTTPDETISGAFSAGFAPVTQIRMGLINNIAFATTVTVDAFAWSDEVQPGPLTAEETATATLAASMANTATGTAVHSATATLSVTLTPSAGLAGAQATTAALAVGLANTATAALGVGAWGTVSERFTGGSAGATITTGNTIFDAVPSVNVKFASSSMDGMAAQKIWTGIASDMELLGAFAPVNSHYHWRGYYLLTSLLPGTIPIAQIEDSLSQVAASVQLTATGKVILRDLGTTVATTAGSHPVGAAFRVEWDVDNTAHTQTARIYSGGNLHGSIPTETITGAYTQSFGPIAFMRMGLINNITIAMTATVDALSWSDVEQPGPLGGVSGVGNLAIGMGLSATAEVADTIESIANIIVSGTASGQTIKAVTASLQIATTAATGANVVLSGRPSIALVLSATATVIPGGGNDRTASLPVGITSTATATVDTPGARNGSLSLGVAMAATAQVVRAGQGSLTISMGLAAVPLGGIYERDAALAVAMTLSADAVAITPLTYYRLVMPQVGLTKTMDGTRLGLYLDKVPTELSIVIDGNRAYSTLRPSSSLDPDSVFLGGHEHRFVASDPRLAILEQAGYELEVVT